MNPSPGPWRAHGNVTVLASRGPSWADFARPFDPLTPDRLVDMLRFFWQLIADKPYYDAMATMGRTASESLEREAAALLERIR